MGLGPDIVETLARARADLRMGVPIVVLGDTHVLAVAVETLTEARLVGMRALGTPLELALTGWRADTLKARVYDGDVARISVPDAAALGMAEVLGRSG